jgi:outer membrane protein
MPELQRTPVIGYKKGKGPIIAQEPATIRGDIIDPAVELRGLGQNTPAELHAIEELADETVKTSGAMFVTPEKVLVKQPVLTALITLNRDLASPYSLEALGAKDIALREALVLARQNNMEIRINQADMDAKKWQYIGSIGGFLPTITNDYQMQALTGQYVSASGLTLPIKNLYLTSTNSFQQYLYKGGSILATYRKAKYDYRASQQGVNRTYADVLTEAANDYHNLVLQDVLLQIRVKGVELARALVILNKDLFEDGVNTKLDVLQSEYELSRARQDLIEQQVKRREAAVKLSTVLNMNPSTDLVINDRLVSKARLVDTRLKITDLVSMAVDNRPELKRYEQLRLAAKEQIKIARAALLPTVSTTGSILGTSAKVVSTTDGGTALGTSGGAGVGGGISGGTSLPLTGATGGSRRWAAKSLYLIGLDANWQIGGLTVTEIGNIRSAQAEARKVQAEFYRELTFVYKDVHDAYLNSMQAENLIAETTDQVAYAEEGLRVAQLRFAEGVGTYIDVINAQRNWINALVSKAQALINFNISQTKLVRSVGRVSVDTLATTGSISSVK